MDFEAQRQRVQRGFSVFSSDTREAMSFVNVGKRVAALVKMFKFPAPTLEPKVICQLVAGFTPPAGNSYTDLRVKEAPRRRAASRGLRHAGRVSLNKNLLLAKQLNCCALPRSTLRIDVR